MSQRNDRHRWLIDPTHRHPGLDPESRYLNPHQEAGPRIKSGVTVMEAEIAEADSNRLPHRNLAAIECRIPPSRDDETGHFPNQLP